MNLVLTGSSSGIGRALAVRLLAGGHRVWGLARSDQSDFVAQHAGKFSASRCDVANWSDVESAAAEVAAAWPHVDGLITCAGLQGEIGRAVVADPAKWSATVRANLDGTFFALRAFDALLARTPRRAKVVCFSGGGATKARANFSAYGAAKTAVVRFVETIAKEESARALDINALAPGAINTRLTEEVLGLGPAVVGEAEFAAAQKQIASGGGSLDQALDCVEWLLSSASDGISGRLISAAWDNWAALPPRKHELAASDTYTLRRVLPAEGSRSKSDSPFTTTTNIRRLKVTVAGLWHLGSVTAASAARHFDVVGLDFRDETVQQLNQGRAPLFEPGLNELVAAGLAAKSLRFTTDAQAACAGADVFWFAYDTPVDVNDESDVASLLAHLGRCAPHLAAGTLVVISSQLPVGTCRDLEKLYPTLHFACSPENLRLGRALETFAHPERIVIGVRDDSRRALLTELFSPFCANLQFMRTESAEMMKHALNSFLALSITYINEIARLCEVSGADAREVAAGLKSEARIGPGAYLSPGGPFAGGTLARDVVSLTRLGRDHREQLSLIPAIKQSNDHHRGWALRRLQTQLGSVAGKRVALLGLTYKPGTDTLHRSAAVELGQQLLAAGASVRAFDPVIPALPPHLAGFTRCETLAAALAEADAAVVCTEWPEFRQAAWPVLVETMVAPRLVIDANRFLEKQLTGVTGVSYLTVGRPL
jgi:nucleotide sugar dehydrogenase